MKWEEQNKNEEDNIMLVEDKTVLHKEFFLLNLLEM